MIIIQLSTKTSIDNCEEIAKQYVTKEVITKEDAYDGFTNRARAEPEVRWLPVVHLLQ